MEKQKELWSRLTARSGWESELYLVMQRAMGGLSGMVGRVVSSGVPRVENVPVGEVTARAGQPDAKVVGIYLLLESNLRGQAILIMSRESALKMADLLMGEQLGTTTNLGTEEYSALAEVGNVTVSHFLSAALGADGSPELLRLSAPTVMEGKLDTMLDVIVGPVAAVRDDLVIIESSFQDSHNAIRGLMWVLPDPTLKETPGPVDGVAPGVVIH